MKRVISAFMCAAVALGSLTACDLKTTTQSTEATTAAADVEYAQFFQKDNVIDVSIDIDQSDLDEIYADPTAEEYYSADITVDGVKVENAGIRTKGNMTLSSVANSDSTRYSYRIKFDKYEDNQTLLGLDELCLNNE
jgi:spore coat protein CotH